VVLLSFVAAFLAASANRSDASEITLVDTFSQGQLVSTPPGGGTASSVLTGLDVLGGSRGLTLVGGLGPPSSSLVAGVYKNLFELESFLYPDGSLTARWDANGAGLGLDLTDMYGMSFQRGDSDGINEIVVRLITSAGNFFSLTTSTRGGDGINEILVHPGSFQEGIYDFARFIAI